MLIFASPILNFLPQLFPLAKNIVMFDWFDIVFRPSPAEYIFSFELRFIFLYFEKSKSEKIAVFLFNKKIKSKFVTKYSFA